MGKLSIGICGWGNVATGLFNALNANAEQIKNTSGLDISIGVIGARRDNPKCDLFLLHCYLNTLKVEGLFPSLYQKVQNAFY